MYLCAELQAGQCVSWVEYTSIFLLPEGAGLKIGAALFGATVLAWACGFVARFILNR